MIREIKLRINELEVGVRHKPLTGWIDFDSAISAFRNWRKSLVITRVDKAANCLCIICKACYVQLAKAEMEGPGYSRVEGDLVSIKSVIVKRQWNFYDRNFYPSLKYVNVVRKIPFRLSSPQRIDYLYAI